MDFVTEDMTPPSASASVPTTGMAQVQNAVEFTNQQVLQPDVKPITGTAKMLADQAAAMMIEDMRSFLQANEQIMAIATAKALALVMAGDENGATALTAIGVMQTTTLPAFAAAIGTTATTIAGDFV